MKYTNFLWSLDPVSLFQVITFLTKVNIFLQTLSGNKQEGVDGVEETPEDYFQPAHTGGRLTKRKKR